jgi:membrane associated rhomboid family serine protease
VIPIRDDNPVRIVAFVTWGLIAANVLAFVLQLAGGADAVRVVYGLGAVPAVLTGRAPGMDPGLVWLTPITSLFLHGGLLHLGGNMLYLWIFGNNVEEAMGHGRFLIFYLLCGALATGGHVLANPASNLPVIGASGAISGVLGAYLLLFPHARVLTLIPLGFLTRLVYIPAVVLLGLWILLQVVSGLLTAQEAGGVAWFAHIGGFLAGLVLVGPFKRRGVRLLGR